VKLRWNLPSLSGRLLRGRYCALCANSAPFIAGKVEKMISNEFKTFLIALLTSWQVIVAAVVVVLYIALVNYVTNFNPEAKPKVKQKVKVKKEKVKKARKKKKGEEDEEDEALLEKET
jgi:uncharacterized membrane protein (DUF106 family)